MALRPTQTPRGVATAPDTAMPLFEPTWTPRATLRIITPTPAAPLVSAPTRTPAPPSGTPTGTSPATLLPTGSTFVIGRSAQGRDILAWRLGAGEKTLLLVGGIHAGFEGNTVMLVNELVAHFERSPGDVLPGMTLLLVPVANPDGLVLGRQAAGRFNANGVDLNRNWACGWSAEAFWQNQRVDPGRAAFSESETQALAQLIRSVPPSAAIFYHSAAQGIFAGDCEGTSRSLGFATILGEATGYPYGEAFSAYPVSGTAANWLDGLGIPAVDLELTSTRDSEFVRNLRGVMAAQCWLIGVPAAQAIESCRRLGVGG